MRRNTDEKRAAAAEKRRAIITAERALDEVKRAELLAAAGVIRTVEGAALSARNTILVAMQAGSAGFSASIVGGFKQWRDVGRRVRRGARGLLIMFPHNKGKNGDGDGGADNGDNGDNGGESRMRFGLGYVFDISQTTVEAGADDDGDGIGAEPERVKVEPEPVEVAEPVQVSAAAVSAGGVDFIAAALAAIA